MKVAFLTLGCRVNQSESSVLEGTLKENGATIVNLNDNPDYCVVNTCTVTSKSDYNSRQLLRRAAKTGAKVIVTGCYSQLQPEVVKAIPGIMEVVDSRKKHEIVSLITGLQLDLAFGNHSRSRPHLKVQDGCNFSCAYCSVPLARGRSRSVPMHEVIRQAQIIEDNGYHEIVLTGIHLGTYGHDLEDKTDLVSLLQKLLVKTTSSRIRLSSLEINEVDDDLIELLKDDRLCKHLHLPLQSGSEKILRLMRRTYAPATFLDRVSKILSRVDNIALGSDIIVGFPGEGAEEFSQTYELLADLPFSYLHVFPFSPRPRTAAAVMPGRPSREIQSERIGKLKDLDGKLRKAYMSRQIGRELDVILEHEKEGCVVIGTSGNYLKIEVPLEGHGKGRVVPVRVRKLAGNIMKGDVIQQL
jgi:threonylcarbamoyladenosine tRNA methylthiotransferase MtaB